MRKMFSPNEEIEYARLYGDYSLAISDSYQKLVSYGTESREFQEANAYAAELCARMRKIEERARDSGLENRYSLFARQSSSSHH